MASKRASASPRRPASERERACASSIPRYTRAPPSSSFVKFTRRGTGVARGGGGRGPSAEGV
eukprot:12198808-Alexandrium_andersonii.AAC.1